MKWDGTLQRQRANIPFGHLVKLTRQDPTIGFFWTLVTLHVIVWTILSTLTQPNLPAETLEMLSSGRDFSWGYASHPPLGVWLATIVNSLAAPSNWPVYMLAQICSVTSVWAAWKLARSFLHPWTALCGALVLLGGYSCTLAASAFTGDLLAGAFWSLSIYVFHRALTQERRRYWAATGICLALGFLSSYGTFLLLLTMFIFTLVDDRARRCWDSSWPFLAGMAMLACLMPHFLWLTQHQFLTVQAGIERSASVAHHLIQPLSFLGTQLLCVIPVVILLTPLVAWFSFEEPARSEEDDREFARRFLLWMTCLPPAIIFGLALVAGPSSGLFAGVTNWSFLGVAILMWGHLNETRISWRRSIIRIGAAVGMFAAALIALNLMVPQIQRQGVATQFPGQELSRQIESLWARFGHAGDAPIVAGSANLVRHATWYSNNHSLGYHDMDPFKSPGINDQKLIREGGVVVWEIGGKNEITPEQLQARFGQVSIVSPVDMRWQIDSTLPPVRVGMAVVHPAGSQILSTLPPGASTIPSGNSLPGGYPGQTNPPLASQSGGFTPTYQPASNSDPVPTPANLPPRYEFTGSSTIPTGATNNPQPTLAPGVSVNPIGSGAPLNNGFPANYPAANYSSIPQSSLPSQAVTQPGTQNQNGQQPAVPQMSYELPVNLWAQPAAAQTPAKQNGSTPLVSPIPTMPAPQGSRSEFISQ